MNLPQFIGHHQVFKVFYFPFMGSIPFTGIMSCRRIPPCFCGPCLFVAVFATICYFVGMNLTVSCLDVQIQ